MEDVEMTGGQIDTSDKSTPRREVGAPGTTTTSAVPKQEDTSYIRLGLYRPLDDPRFRSKQKHIIKSGKDVSLHLLLEPEQLTRFLGLPRGVRNQVIHIVFDPAPPLFAIADLDMDLAHRVGKTFAGLPELEQFSFNILDESKSKGKIYKERLMLRLKALFNPVLKSRRGLKCKTRHRLRYMAVCPEDVWSVAHCFKKLNL